MGWLFGGYTKKDISEREELADIDGLLWVTEELCKGWDNDIEKGGVLLAAIEALGRIGGERATEKLIWFLGGGQWQHRMAAAKALGNLKVTRAAKPLYDALEEEYARELELRIEYIRALGKIRNEEAIVLLIRALGIQEEEPPYEIYSRSPYMVAGIHAAAEKELNKIPGGKERLSERLKIVKTALGGDEDDNTKKSNTGSGGDDKFTKLKELKEMLSEGLIDEDEFKQMKKEILGK